ncbi:hypothetical protein [Pseudoxanthomonas sp. JBR18]|uniref:hypothetical protein n=1 Tax=Pseudoxanthomonas sp. JBR18 TaxID=2969308 RepID=UPI0023068CE8|nr:hypothetical protein [Pseudoxanthomonas sp. JBR18]WCE05959.1 hypothetical protein PJ250_08425 [Pseudoxanthomonas sp. JBR18]
MKSASVIAPGLILALAATACGSTPMHSQVPRTHVDVKDNQPPRPVIQRNPHPTAYEVTVAIKDAPGPFEVVKAAMQYEVLEPSCRPDLGGMAGTRASLLEWIPVELHKQADDTYRGTIYDGLLKDEDYYGLGVCHWSLVTVQFKLLKSLQESDPSFSYHLWHEDLQHATQVPAYFPRSAYNDTSSEGIAFPGVDSPEKFKPEARDKLFVMSISIN